ncbi:MAG: DUF3999 domain-containing protein [Pseudomonadota bacterium]
MKKIRFLLLSLLTCMCFSAHANADSNSSQLLKPQSFAYQAAIDLKGTGPFHQLTIPMAVYQSIRHGDLSDIRIFNGQGNIVPHALITPRPVAAVLHEKEQEVPFFPIHASLANASDDLSMEVQRNSDGTLISLRQSTVSTNEKDRHVIKGVVVDLSQIKEAVHSLRIEAEPSKNPFHAFTIDTSNDLQQWRTLKSDAQLVRLEHAGQRIEKNTVDWEGYSEKYLRIVWQDPTQAPAIKGISAQIIHSTAQLNALIWSDAFLPTRAQEQLYEYHLPGFMPLEQLRIELSQANTVAPISIQTYNRADSSSQHHSKGVWITLEKSIVFRLTSPQGEVHSSDISLQHSAENQLRLVADPRSGNVFQIPPAIRIGFTPHTLVFLQNGTGPFTLAWGMNASQSTTLPIETLIPGYRDDQPLVASPAMLAPIKLPTPYQAPLSDNDDSEKKSSKPLLWALLITGVLILGGMVWKLIKLTKP